MSVQGRLSRLKRVPEEIGNKQLSAAFTGQAPYQESRCRVNVLDRNVSNKTARRHGDAEVVKAPSAHSASVALIVDDDSLFRMALTTILTDRLGVSKVIEVADFDKALEHLSDNANISVALFDLAMPGIKSPANLRVVRETFPNVRTAVVSASISRRDVLVSLEAGVHGCVPKNLGIVELTAALKSIFEGTVYVPSFLPDVSKRAEESLLSSHEAANATVAFTLDALTPRQREVLHLLVASKSNKEIARSLKLSEGTVKAHVSALFGNLGVDSRVAAAVAGARLVADS